MGECELPLFQCQATLSLLFDELGAESSLLAPLGAELGDGLLVVRFWVRVVLYPPHSVF